jgi:hypothetical protein
MMFRVLTLVLATSLGASGLAIAAPPTARPVKPVPYPTQKTVQKYAELDEVVRAYRRPSLPSPAVVGRPMLAKGVVHAAGDATLLLAVPIDPARLAGLPASTYRRVLDPAGIDERVIYDGKLYMRYVVDESAFPSDRLESLVGRSVELELIRREGQLPIAVRVVTP